MTLLLMEIIYFVLDIKQSNVTLGSAPLFKLPLPQLL